jgi:hypothetical protein
MDIHDEESGEEGHPIRETYPARVAYKPASVHDRGLHDRLDAGRSSPEKAGERLQIEKPFYDRPARLPDEERESTVLPLRSARTYIEPDYDDLETPAYLRRRSR